MRLNTFLRWAYAEYALHSEKKIRQHVRAYSERILIEFAVLISGQPEVHHGCACALMLRFIGLHMGDLSNVSVGGRDFGFLMSPDISILRPRLELEPH